MSVAQHDAYSLTMQYGALGQPPNNLLLFFFCNPIYQLLQNISRGIADCLSFYLTDLKVCSCVSNDIDHKLLR